MVSYIVTLITRTIPQASALWDEEMVPRQLRERNGWLFSGELTIMSVSILTCIRSQSTWENGLFLSNR